MNYRWRELPQVPFLLLQTFVATKLRLSRQKYACRDINNYLLQQIRVCRDKSKLVATKLLLVATKAFVATKLRLSQQKTCFVATNPCLSRQKLYLCQLPPTIVNDDEEDE